MREIKFRAYIKHSARIATVLELNAENGSVFTDGYKYGLSRDDVELMQYTGLKDKNGVDIYEGDIVCGFDHYGDMCWNKTLVTHSSSSFGLKVCGTRSYIPLFEIDGIAWEVIGNIHQNPELLK